MSQKQKISLSLFSLPSQTMDGVSLRRTAVLMECFLCLYKHVEREMETSYIGRYFVYESIAGHYV